MEDFDTTGLSCPLPCDYCDDPSTCEGCIQTDKLQEQCADEVYDILVRLKDDDPDIDGITIRMQSHPLFEPKHGKPL